MGKIIGALIGLMFGPLGAIIGFLIGAFFDTKITFRNTSFFGDDFFSNQFESNNLFQEAFPFFAAVVTRAGGTKKSTVLIIKNMMTEIYSPQQAAVMMHQFKNYVQDGYRSSFYREVCESILYQIPHQTKIYLISTLFTIIRTDLYNSQLELNSIHQIAADIGISEYEFNSMFHHFNQNDSGYQQYSYQRQPIKDPYKIMGIDPSADNDKIKKQYRKLCKQYHPDVTSHLSKEEQKKAELKMKEIIDAYEHIKKEKSIK